MTKTSWELLDPITVLPDGGMPAMDGIVAFLDHPENPTKVGVRLTGSSIGLGDHSGSVDGIDYFECPLNSGLFCTPDQLEVRTLSRIEQLRLKRELAAGQLDMSKGGSMMMAAAGYGDSNISSKQVIRSSMIGHGGLPPSITNHHQAIVPQQDQPQSISLNGLSPTALARLQQINPGYMDPNVTPVSSSTAPAAPAAAADDPPLTVPEEDDEDDEMLVSDHEDEEGENYDDAAEEEYLQINRQHISRLQQRKEEIKQRKLELQKGKARGDNSNGESSNNEAAPPPLTDEGQTAAVVTPSKRGGGETTTTTTATTTTTSNDTSMEESSSSEPPLSRLEQLKLKKRQLETTPATATTPTSATTTQSSTVNSIVSMAAAATAQEQAAAPGEEASEQVPWPFPATSREVPPNTTTIVPGAESQQAQPVPVPALATATEEPLSRLELLKLKKRQLEEAGPPAAPAPKAPKTTTLDSTARTSPRPVAVAASPISPTPPTATLILPASMSMDRGAPPPVINRGGVRSQPPKPKPAELSVQIMNSSTKRFKEVPLKISNDINLYSAVYDHQSVKQANVRKWGTSFVQQVKEKKSEIRCRVLLLSNPPPELANEPNKSMPMELSVDQLKVTTTELLWNQYKDNFHAGRSKVQMLLRCQPINGNGQEKEEEEVQDSSNKKLFTDQEEEEEGEPTAAEDSAPAPKEEEREIQIPAHFDRSSITSIASQLGDVKHQLRIKVINERTRYFKDLLVETSPQINLYEAIYNNPAVKEAKVRKWNSSIVEQVRSGMAEIVCQICTIPNGKPEHLVKHGALTIEQLKECSTTELYTRYAMDHYDLENDQSLIQLVLKCQQTKTPVASNQASKPKPQGPLVTPTKLADSLPPVTPQAEASRGNPATETAPIVSQQTHPRTSPTEASQSSLSSMERKPTNSPYAKAASAALPMHNTQTTFSDLLRHEQQQQQAILSPNSVVMTPDRDPELGLGRIAEPIETKVDAGVQTAIEMTTPVRDNRHPSPQQRMQQQRPMTFAEKLQEVDPYWWLAIIFILAAAFFAALFLGPIS
ncbi:unnamed protein product [Cylindrotheca closterium]|uniref:CAP-Gly domain-containing protein n=1 Tax=Cylindrotheca closterium TaxID=2856 RepID=A0AAD2G1S7_9STRA|nr:unnamed protein product [Cylindrotheca closterium]